MAGWSDVGKPFVVVNRLDKTLRRPRPWCTAFGEEEAGDRWGVGVEALWAVRKGFYNMRSGAEGKAATPRPTVFHEVWWQ
jgi:hypothetical protein